MLTGLARSIVIHMFGGFSLALMILIGNSPEVPLSGGIAIMLGPYGGLLMFISLRYYFPELKPKYGFMIVGLWTVGVVLVLLGVIFCMAPLMVLLVMTASARVKPGRALIGMVIAFFVAVVLFRFSFEQGDYLLTSLDDPQREVWRSLLSGAVTGIGVGVAVHGLSVWLRGNQMQPVWRFPDEPETA